MSRRRVRIRGKVQASGTVYVAPERTIDAPVPGGGTRAVTLAYASNRIYEVDKHGTKRRVKIVKDGIVVGDLKTGAA